MPTISKKELEDYQQLCKDRNNGRILTPGRTKACVRGTEQRPRSHRETFPRSTGPVPSV